MTRRRLAVLALAGVAAVALAVLSVYWGLSRPRASREQLEQVRVGMTRAEVIATVGRPPGNYTGGRLFVGLAVPEPSDQWTLDEGYLLVTFGPDGRAASVSLSDFGPPPSVFDRLLDSLGL